MVRYSQLNEGRQRARALPPAISKWGQRGRSCFLITASLVYSRFIKIDFKKFIAIVRPHRKNSECFSLIFVIILRSTLLLNRNKHNW